VSDGWGSLVNQGNHGEHSFRTAADRHRFPGSVSELSGSGMAEGAGPIRRLDTRRGGLCGGGAWWLEALGVGWTDWWIEVSGGGSRV